MRVNVYAEEMTHRITIVRKEVEGQTFTGLRFYLALPVSLATPPTRLGGSPGIVHLSGLFVHQEGDDDSSAVTFWGKHDLRDLLREALAALNEFYASREIAR